MSLTNGTPGDDLIFGSGADDDIFGLGGNDRLEGYGGSDLLDGGDGNDWLVGGLGNDRLYGGAGYDVIDYYFASGGVTVSIADSGDGSSSGADGADDITGVEGINGSQYEDNLTGSAINNSLWGQGGNDNLQGRGGNDFLSGGSGADWIDGGDDDDTVDYFPNDNGPAGPATQGVSVNLLAGSAIDNWNHFDTLVNIENVNGSPMDDLIVGSDGNNTLSGADGRDVMNGRSGNDLLFGGNGNDVLHGEGGRDFFWGNAGNDYIHGGDDDDVAFYEDAPAGVTVNLQDGVATSDGYGTADTIVGVESLHGSYHADNITLGNDANSYVFGRAGADTLIGGSGNNNLIGGSGNDTLNGGAGGFDNADYSNTDYDGGPAPSGSGVTVNLAAGTATDNWGHTDTLISIENVNGSPYSDTITGNTDANSLSGNAGDDNLVGGDGNDFLSGGDGNDTLDGGAGNDNLQGNAGDDTLLGGADGDFLAGGDGEDMVDGGSGFDDLQGNAGDDTLLGGDDNDFLRGGAGQDVLDGGAGINDVAFYEEAPAGVTVNLQQGVASNDGYGTADTIVGVEHLHGSYHADNITLGNDANSYVFGRAGADTLIGGSGNNNLIGGSGSDTIDGGAGDNDIADYGTTDFDGGTKALSGIGVTVDLADGTATDNWGDSDSLTGIENVFGSMLGDSIRGDGLRNQLLGLAGNDVLAGRGGDDYLVGGDGASDVAEYSGQRKDYVFTLNGDFWISDRRSGSPDGTDNGNGIEIFRFADRDYTFEEMTSVNVPPSGTPTASLPGGSEDSSYTVFAGALLQGFYDGNSDPLSVAGLTATHGTLTDNQNGTWTFVPEANYNGAVQLSYSVVDGRGGSVAAQQTFTLAPVNDAPTVTGFIVNGTTISFTASDVDGDALTLNAPFAAAFGNPSISNGTPTTLIATEQTSEVNSTLQVRDAAGVTANVASVYLGTGSANGFVVSGASTVQHFFGFGGNDFFRTGSANDVLQGGDGDDSLFGNGGADRLFGDEGNDLLGGSRTTDATSQLDDGADFLDGGNGNDVIRGNAGADTLIGGDGNDNLRGDVGNDAIDGGPGFDVAAYKLDEAGLGFTSGLTIDLSGLDLSQPSLQFNDFLGGVDTLTSIEKILIQGTLFDDTIIGSQYDDQLGGSKGNDTFEGRGGSDLYVYAVTTGTGGTITATDGFDTIVNNDGSGTGFDQLTFFQMSSSRLYGLRIGNDLVLNVQANDWTGDVPADPAIGSVTVKDLFTLNPANHLDRISFTDAYIDFSLSGTTLSAQVFDASIPSQPVLEETIFWGLGGNETIQGTDGVDEINGGEGDDVLIGQLDGDALFGSDGNDFLYGAYSPGAGTIVSGDGADILDGGAGNDLLRGNNGNDELYGGAGDDNLRGDHGNDVIDGGDGIDVASYRFDQPDAAPGGITTGVFFDARFLDANVEIQLNDGLGTVDRVRGIESLLVSGSAFNDTLIGSNYTDEIAGAAGNDAIAGRSGADNLDGGDGNDVLYGANGSSGVIVANDGVDILNGGAGNDLLRGNDGNDELYGGTGDDNLRGDYGNDIIDGGDGIDFASYRFDESGARPGGIIAGLENAGITFDASAVDSATEIQLPDGLGTTDTVRSIESIGISGSEFNDTFTGSKYRDQIFGRGGADVINAGAGDDVVSGDEFLAGFAGADTLDGGDGTDTASYNFNGSLTAIAFDASAIGPAIAGPVSISDGLGSTDSLSNFERVEIYGGGAGDTLTGSQGDDTLSGGGRDSDNNGTLDIDGDDTLRGGAGNDALDGSLGNDTAIYSGNRTNYAVAVNAGVLTITDLRANSPDGTDTVQNVESFQFADGLFSLADVSSYPYGSPTATLANATEDTDYTITAASLLQGFGDPNGNATLSVQGLTATNGTLSPNADGVSWTFKPNANFFSGAAVVLAYNVSDGSSPAIVATQSFTVTAVNDTPVAVNDTVATPLYPGRSIDIPVLANDSDVETPQDLIVSAVGAPTAGTAVVNATGTGIVYTAPGNFSGPVTFSYTVSDGQGGTATATVSLTVEPTLIGTEQPDTLAGGAANDEIRGLGGDDTLDGKGGNDVLYGGEGNDALIGGTGDDTLYGEAGDDTINGGDGVDVAMGGAGNDVFVISGTVLATEKIDGQGDIDTLRLSANATLSSGSILSSIEQLDLGGNNTLSIATTDLIDFSSMALAGSGQIVGDGQNNRINGTLGNDVFVGGAGADILAGGNGADLFIASGSELNGDVLTGGSGTDTLQFGSAITLNQGFVVASDIETLDMGKKSVTVATTALVDFQAISTVLNAAAFNGDATANTISGTQGADVINGNAGNDILRGAGGNDQVYGNDGADLLFGGAGNDQLYGGTTSKKGDGASDIFVFNTAPGAGNVDTIFAFEATNQDKIALDTAIFGGVGFTNGALNGANFVSNAGGNATTAGHRVLFDTSTGNLFFDADGNGATGKVLFATLNGTIGSVDASDFVNGSNYGP